MTLDTAIGIHKAEVEQLFGFGRKTSRWGDVNYLELVPVHRSPWLDDPDRERILILMPRYSDPILSRLVQPRLSEAKKHIRVPLEGRGSFLWRLVDGKRTVADLVTLFEVEYPTDNEDVPTRVSMYLHAMYDNKFIKYINL